MMCEDYRNGPTFSDRQIGANSVDPDQIAPRGGSTLFVTPSTSYRRMG